MVRKKIETGDLEALNLILDRDANLALIVFARLEAVNAALAVQTPPAEAQAPGPSPSEINQSQTAEIQPRILTWFQTHPGKHSLTTVRADLGVPATSKPFKTAVQNLIQDKAVKFNEKRGKGAEYWLA